MGRGPPSQVGPEQLLISGTDTDTIRAANCAVQPSHPTPIWHGSVTPAKSAASQLCRSNHIWFRWVGSPKD